MRTDAADLYRKIRHWTGRLPVFAVAVAIGIAVASFVPQLSEAVRTALGFASEHGRRRATGKRRWTMRGNESGTPQSTMSNPPLSS